ncbi:hypothetical protein [Paenibacillus sp. FSL P2-0136]|uniref:hypothetical protein n=1 Tax=Paenibacillus sp. FSL P2-0136 TaxID=2975317 RepID=UPI0030DBDB92
MNMNMNVDVDRVEEPPVQLIGMLGQPYDPKRVQAVLKPYGVKRMPAAKSYFNDTMISCAKASLRMDLYRIPKINELTGLQYTKPDDWIIGAIHFLPPGSGKQNEVPYPVILPEDITMNSSPEEAIAAYGPPQLDEECEWPGFSGRIIAWRGEGINIALEYEYSREGRVLRTYIACLIGCIGAWRSDNPEVFAP